MQKVVDTLVEIALLPVSFIIIGVGDANFEKLKIFTSNSALKSSEGKAAIRDNINF